jgi:hypothetical protein
MYISCTPPQSRDLSTLYVDSSLALLIIDKISSKRGTCRSDDQAISVDPLLADIPPRLIAVDTILTLVKCTAEPDILEDGTGFASTASL